MTILNSDIYYLIIKQMDIEDLQNFCIINKYVSQICSKYKSNISKHFLKVYQVDYKDPSNFIYLYNNVKIEDYKEFGKWEYHSLLELYLKNYKNLIIKCSKNITSFPPKMINFSGYDNQLTSFPIQPEMEDFHGVNNRLTSFPIQPKMINFYGNRNQLTSFPIQPKMIKF